MLQKGIIPAVVMPMDKNAQPIFEEYEKYLKWLSSFKIVGVAVNVDTGEGPTLKEEERIKAIKIAKSVFKDRTVIAGIPGPSTALAIEVAKDAKMAGADMGLVFPNPAFMGHPLPPDLPYEYHKAISEVANLDIILFQLQPALGGIEYPSEILAKLASLKHVKAIKEASFDAKKFLDTLRLFRKVAPDVLFLTGNDNFIFESFVLGCDGALIGYGTLAVKDMVDMFEYVQKGNIKEGMYIWQKTLPLVEAIFSPPVRNYRARLKYALSQLGVISENAIYVRPPLLNISEEEKEKVKAALKVAELL
jgi:4-hydroxy-tetrahydrodipicolinate synthase